MEEKTVYVLRIKRNSIIEKIAREQSIKLVFIEEIAFLQLILSKENSSIFDPICALIDYDFVFFRHILNLLSNTSASVIINFLVHTLDDENIVQSIPTYGKNKILANQFPQTKSDWTAVLNEFGDN